MWTTKTFRVWYSADVTFIVAHLQSEKAFILKVIKKQLVKEANFVVSITLTWALELRGRTTLAVRSEKECPGIYCIMGKLHTNDKGPKYCGIVACRGSVRSENASLRYVMLWLNVGKEIGIEKGSPRYDWIMGKLHIEIGGPKIRDKKLLMLKAF